MSSGHDIECVVLQKNPDTVVVRRGYGTMSIPREMISAVTKEPVIKEDVSPATKPSEGHRLPPWSIIVAKIVKQAWAANLRQIPATVIDKGALRSVPYQSYRCGEDYEVNIYGDPDEPAGIEIGMYRRLLHDSQARANCIDLIADVLGDPVDAAVVKVLDRQKDLTLRNGLTTEISPETEEDSYGGWWVSVYDKAALDKARATPDELKQITVASPPVAVVAATPASPPSQPISAATAVAQAAIDSGSWSSTDLASARPSAAWAGGSDAGYGGGGEKSVYVRGYYRSNGTYVGSYDRAAPGFGSGRGGGHR